jgi:hypothetical protein
MIAVMTEILDIHIILGKEANNILGAGSASVLINSARG